MSRYTPPRSPRGELAAANAARFDEIAGRFAEILAGLDVPEVLAEEYARHGLPMRTEHDGCDSCDAYTVLRRAQRHEWRLTVHHDDDCPRWARIRGAA
jgi:hypothetical protein